MPKTLIPRELRFQIQTIAQKTGTSEQELFRNAVRYYIDSVKQYLDLDEEMKGWDQLSDEALLNFERSI